MRSPQDMETIQIDITNACVHTCSNCTRACGHHKKNFFMDWETFKKAVDSLEGFNGTIGIMGGEPTLHPEFERFVSYLKEKKKQKSETGLLKPTNSFMDQVYYEVRDNYHLVDKSDGGKMLKVTGAGLWSSLASNYYKYYEIIQDTFDYQCLNDHNNVSYHQPLLVSRHDLDISDEEWYPMRDKCWIQNSWSATVTPKGAFFCEVAGALDMLFNGPGGWKIEKDWWRRKPEDFADQLHWCEICGLALDTRRRNANESVDDVSESIYEKLKELESPKVKKGNISIYLKDEIESEKRNKEMQFFKEFNYISGYEDRLSNINRNIYPKGFEGIVLYKSQPIEEFKKLLENNLEQLDSIVIIVEDNIVLENLKAEIKGKVKFVLREKNWGSALNAALNFLDASKFTVILSDNFKLDSDFKEKLMTYVLNPGTYLYKQLEEKFISIFNVNAKALKNAGFDGIKYCNDIEQFAALWEENKKVELTEELFKKKSDILKLEKNGKYVLYAVGGSARKIKEAVERAEAELVYCGDSNSDKWNTDFMGIKILSPQDLLSKKADYDKLIIGSMRVIEIKAKLIEQGFKDEDIIYPVWEK